MECEQLVQRWMRNFIRRARELLLTYLAKGETEIAVLFSSHLLTCSWVSKDTTSVALNGLFRTDMTYFCSLSSPD